VQFEGGFAHHVLTAKSMEARHVASGARARGAGTIAVVDHGPRLDLKGSWEQFRWPLPGRDPVVRSAAGTFTLEGILPYRVHVDGDMRALDLPSMPVDVDGTLDKDSFAFRRAEVDLYGGHTSASGKVTWGREETYEVSGHASGIDPAQLRADLPGSLSFDYNVSGRGFDTRGTLNAAFSALTGKLRGAPASGSGAFTHAGKTWSFNALRVALGSTTLALDGQIDERLNLRFALSAQDLSLVSPGSRGRIKASGTLGGTLSDPAVVGVAHAVGVDYEGIKFEAADSDVDFEPDAPTKESKIDARLHGLSYGEHTLEAATFTLSGPPSDYLVHVTANAPGIAASAQAHGTYAHEIFQGQLTALSLNGSESLHLTLERPVDLLASLDHARLQWVCLVGTPGSVCADAEWRPSGGRPPS
jgi:translocation and assembly module TamB